MTADAARRARRGSILAFSVSTLAVAGLVIVGLLGPPASDVYLVFLMLAYSVTCYRYLLQRDPIAWLSIAGPLVILVILGIVAGPVAGLAARVATAIGAALWMLVWLLAFPRLWRPWARFTLRRWSSTSVEEQVAHEYDRLWRRWEAARDGDEAMVVRRSASDLRARWAETKAEPLLTATTLWLDQRRDDPSSAAWRERLAARMREEWAHLWGPRWTLPIAPRDPQPIQRPTRGSELELAFPDLEALVAVARPNEHRAVALACSRAAVRESDIRDARVTDALNAAERDEVTTDHRKGVDLALEEVRAEIGERGPALQKTDRQQLRALERRWCAIASTVLAIAPELDSRRMGHAIANAAHAIGRPGTSATLLMDAIRSVIGDARANAAVEIEPDPTMLSDVREEALQSRGASGPRRSWWR